MKNMKFKDIQGILLKFFLSKNQGCLPTYLFFLDIFLVKHIDFNYSLS